ncbi:MAG: PP2C family protein-serine/threonine phosphatase [Spirochaetaceae bacterium]
MSERSPDQNVVLPDKWQVLVVDDDPTGHLIPRSVMENLTFEGKPVEVIDAYSSQEAIEYLKTYPDIAVAVIDIILKTRDEGLQLVRTIREEMENKLIRIILRTSEEHHFPENQIIIDYDINGYTGRNESSAKQLVTSIITAFRSYQDLRTIYTLNRSLEEKVRDRTKALSDANFKLRSYISRLENDQEAGSKMQQKLLPESERGYGDCSFSSKIYTSMYLSGDFLDYFEIDSDRVGFYVADVSGHGISSAFITVLLKNFIDTHLENYWNEGNPLVFKPVHIAERLNGEILREKFGKYLTMFYGIIDRREGTLTYTNCGQFPYPLLKQEGRTEVLSATGTPIGLFQEPEFVGETVEISNQATLLIISDGILELLPETSIKKKRKFITSIFESDGKDLEQVTEKLGLSNYYYYPDDITFLMVKRGGGDG